MVNRKPHTLILDRGRITHVSPARVTLYEVDRSVVAVKLTPRTLIQVNGVAATTYALKTRMRALVMRIDGGVAVRISTKSRAPKTPRPPVKR